MIPYIIVNWVEMTDPKFNLTAEQLFMMGFLKKNMILGLLAHIFMIMIDKYIYNQNSFKKQLTTQVDRLNNSRVTNKLDIYYDCNVINNGNDKINIIGQRMTVNYDDIFVKTNKSFSLVAKLYYQYVQIIAIHYMVFFIFPNIQYNEA